MPERKLKGSMQEKAQEYNYVAIMLCGGKGSRLLPVRGEVPKPLFKIREKELIRYSVEQMDPSLVDELVFATHHKAEQIEAWVQSTNIPNRFKFSRQTNRGVPNAIKEALSQTHRDRIIICNTDEIRLNFNLLGAIQFHEAHSLPATVVVTYGTSLHKHTLLEIDQNRVVTNTIPNPNVPVDQLDLIDTSFFIINRDVVTDLDFDETTSYKGITKPLVEAGRLKAYIEQNMVYLNINTREEVEEAKRLLR